MKPCKKIYLNFFLSLLSGLNLISNKGAGIFWAFDRHSIETVTLSKYEAEYE